MPESNQTEKATPHRRQKAREQGQIVRSREFGSLIAVISALLVVSNQINGMASHWRGFYTGLLTTASTGDITAGGPVLFWTSIEVLRWIAPPLLVALLFSVAVTLAQGGFNFAPASLALKPERLNPAARAGQIFSISSLGTLLRSMVPFGLIAAFGISAIHTGWNEFGQAANQDLGSLAHQVSEGIRTLVWKSAIVLLVAAAFDYLLTWRQNESKLRMSREEIKREHKENDGNPASKMNQMKRRRQMRERKPLQAAATATMIVTNPTHFAVALRYDPSMSAPEVVAKGQDLLAQRIKEIAAEHNVPMIENRPLARALYRTVEVGGAIPPELYQAVAEILVAVLRAQDEVKRANEQRGRLDAAGRATGEA